MSQVSDLVSKLVTDVAAERTQVDSVLTLITGIPALITAAVNDALAANPSLSPADLQSLTDAAANIEGQTSALAAAVASNVPGTGSSNEGSVAPTTPNPNNPDDFTFTPPSA